MAATRLGPARRLPIAAALICAWLTGAAAQPAGGPLPPVPTTRVLAIGRLTVTPGSEQMRALMPAEVRDTVALYLAGKIDQWFVRQDQPGVVFLMNVTSVAEAERLLEQLPLGIAHAMTFELLPLGPLSPLSVLLRGAPPRP